MLDARYSLARARVQIANGALTEQNIKAVMQARTAEMQSLALKSLRSEYDISRSAGALYSLLVVTLSALSVMLALVVWLYLRRRHRIAELEQAVQNERLITQTIARTQEAERSRIWRDLQSIFTAIRNLTPPEVDGDFPGSIRELCQNVTSISRIPCKNFINSDIAQKLNELDAPQKLHVYRIIQESLNNAVRHARPTECSLIIMGTQKAIDIFVTDDGTGFDPSDEIPQNSFGIAGMKSRAKAIGGGNREFVKFSV